MTNKAKRRYRIRNWPDYNSALVRRGSLTLWVEPGVAGRWQETAMMRLKTIFPGRLKSRERKRQETELRVRCAALNRMTGLRMPQSYAV